MGQILRHALRRFLPSSNIYPEPNDVPVAILLDATVLTERRDMDFIPFRFSGGRGLDDITRRC